MEDLSMTLLTWVEKEGWKFAEGWMHVQVMVMVNSL